MKMRGVNKGMAAWALLFSIGAQGQNLVANGSFEEYSACPPSIGYWANVEGWISPFTESADYFNECAQNPACSVPLNDFGFQYAADGQAYMGIFTYVDQGGYYREIIATELIQPLQVGVPVYCSLMAAPGGFGINPANSAKLAAKGPGIHFFTRLPATSQPWLFSEWTSFLFPNSAAIEMPTVLNDTLSWVTIGGVFVPDSAYTWMAITNFYENELSMPELLDDGAIQAAAYAFIDNVCVSYDSAYCSISTAVSDLSIAETRVSPNPFHEGFNVICEASHSLPFRVDLTDIHGRTCWTGGWPMSQNVCSIRIPQLTGGVYFLVLHFPDGKRTSMRVIRSPQ